jgi:hypothetical protein
VEKLSEKRELQFLQIPFFIQFTLGKNIFYVPAYDASVPLKEFSHLLLGKPNRIIVKGYIYFSQAVFGLVHDEAGLGGRGIRHCGAP